MEQLKVAIRWSKLEGKNILADLGIETDEETPWEYKNIVLNINNIDHIEEYEGYICVSLSGQVYVTELIYTTTNLAKFKGYEST